MTETPAAILDENEPYGDLPFGDARGRIYHASRGGKHCPHLRFVPTDGETDYQLPYHDIRLTLVRKDGREIRLEFSQVVVVISGRNLLSVASAIGAHGCSCIEAFNPAKRDEPDGEAPVVDSIKFWMPEAPERRAATATKKPLAAQIVVGA